MVEARPTPNHDLGDLMPAVSGRFKKLLKKAKDAASSRNQKERIDELSSLSCDFGQKYSATNTEQWGINASLHYNEWANLSSADFQKILDSFKQLLAVLRCQDCNSWFYVSTIERQPEAIRCNCGNKNYNLRKKKLDPI